MQDNLEQFDAATYGTRGYKAPEVETHNQYYSRDLWSLGVTILFWVLNNLYFNLTVLQGIW